MIPTLPARLPRRSGSSISRRLGVDRTYAQIAEQFVLQGVHAGSILSAGVVQAEQVERSVNGVEKYFRNRVVPAGGGFTRRRLTGNHDFTFNAAVILLGEIERYAIGGALVAEELCVEARHLLVVDQRNADASSRATQSPERSFDRAEQQSRGNMYPLTLLSDINTEW